MSRIFFSTAANGTGAGSGIDASFSRTQPLMFTTAVWNCGVFGSHALRMMKLRPSRYVRVVASADSFITRTLTMVASGATPTRSPATSDATLVPCDAPTSSLQFEKHGSIALFLLTQVDEPTVSDAAASKPPMTRLPNSTCVASTPVSMT